MFCDLVGSTALSTRHDPEDLRELIGDYHRAVSDAVGRFDGFVAKYMGDGVLIYFGYPRAHEDDAERAVRAGLAAIEAVGQLPARQDLRVRLGIATGLAVVGDLIGEGAAQERGVVGETPNLAARLQALTRPNTLIIGEATRPADWRAVRSGRPRTATTCRLWWAATRLAGVGRERRGQPLRGAADPAAQPQGQTAARSLYPAPAGGFSAKAAAVTCPASACLKWISEMCKKSMYGPLSLHRLGRRGAAIPYTTLSRRGHGMRGLLFSSCSVISSLRLRSPDSNLAAILYKQWRPRSS
jgi:class 3 adenylate cyclase